MIIILAVLSLLIFFMLKHRIEAEAEEDDMAKRIGRLTERVKEIIEED